MALFNKNGFRNFTPDIHHGPLYSKDYDSDGALWLPAAGGAGSCFTFVGTFTNTRVAAGDYKLALTAAANSPFVVFDLQQAFEKLGSDPIFSSVSFGAGAVPALSSSAAYGPTSEVVPATGVGPLKVSDDFEGHILRGFMLTSYDVVYSLATANLTTHTGTLYSTSYSTSGAAGVVTTKDAAQALGIVTSANIIVSSIKVAVPYVIGLNGSVPGGPDLADYLEIAIVNPGTSVYSIYGIRMYYDYCLL